MDMTEVQKPVEKKWEAWQIVGIVSIIIASIILIAAVVNAAIADPTKYSEILPKDTKLKVGDTIVSHDGYVLSIGDGKIVNKTKAGVVYWEILVPDIKNLYVGPDGDLVADSNTAVAVWKSPANVHYTTGDFVPGSTLLNGGNNVVLKSPDGKPTWNSLGHFHSLNDYTNS
jgi:hypothetical protein